MTFIWVLVQMAPHTIPLGIPAHFATYMHMPRLPHSRLLWVSWWNGLIVSLQDLAFNPCCWHQWVVWEWDCVHKQVIIDWWCGGRRKPYSSTTKTLAEMRRVDLQTGPLWVLILHIHIHTHAHACMHARTRVHLTSHPPHTCSYTVCETKALIWPTIYTHTSKSSTIT